MPASTTPRITLPLLSAGQAQKELTHNEALLLLDAVIAPLAETIGTNSPPATSPTAPDAGQCWIIGTAPTGAWAGQAGALALWTHGGWRFVQLPVGARVTHRPDGALWHRRADGWHPPMALSAASGGATVDNECRAALNALLTALASMGLIAQNG